MRPTSGSRAMGIFIPRGGFHGATIDFLLSAKRDTVAAKRFLVKALGAPHHPHPGVINTDKDAAYPADVGCMHKNIDNQTIDG
jgi:transposase-like protein